MAQRRKSGFQISYVNITYQSVFLGSLLLLALVALSISFVFSWSSVDNVRDYHVRLARNKFFRQVYFERQTTGGQIVVPIPEGTRQLPSGQNIITITTQKAKGGFNHISRPIKVQ